jgi:hypothetical protein
MDEKTCIEKMEASIEGIRRNVHILADLLGIDLDAEEPELTDAEEVDRREADWAEDKAVDRDLTERGL